MMQHLSPNTAHHRPVRRQTHRTAAAGGLLLAALAAAPAALADVTASMVAGLPWRSGATGDACLATLRGRALDAVNVFLGHTSFPSLVRQTTGMRAPKRIPLMLVSLPLLTSDTRGQFAQCASGA